MKRNELTAFLALWAFTALGGYGLAAGVGDGDPVTIVAGVLGLLVGLLLALGGWEARR